MMLLDAQNEEKLIDYLKDLDIKIIAASSGDKQNPDILTKNKNNHEFWGDATNACTRIRFTKLAKIFMTDVQAFAFAPNLERPFAILYNVRPISVWM